MTTASKEDAVAVFFQFTQGAPDLLHSEAFRVNWTVRALRATPHTLQSHRRDSWKASSEMCGGVSLQAPTKGEDIVRVLYVVAAVHVLNRCL